MKNTGLILTFLLGLLISSSAYADTQDTYASANQLYQEGKFEEAIERYQSIIDNDELSADIYYNLGNCFYKTDNIPAAILNYERALKLAPNHDDAFFNLKMANKKTTDKIESLPKMFIENTWSNIVTSKTVNSWSYYAVLLAFISLLFLIAYLLSNQTMIKKIGFYMGILLFVGCLFTIVMAAQHHKIIQNSSEAIIFTRTVTIKSEPSVSSEKLFTLHEGTKVKLLEKVNDWNKIQLPNGNVGWILSEDIETI